MPENLVLKKDKAFPGAGSLALLADAPKSPALLEALAEDGPFPPGTTQLGKVSVSGKLNPQQKVAFGKGAGEVTFGGGAGAFGSIGVFPTGDQVLQALQLDPELGAVAMPAASDSQFVVLRTGYRSKATASGAIALGAGLAPTFDANVARSGAFAVVRQLPKATGARTSIQKTLDSWTLPRRVATFKDLAPGAWLVAEVDGSLGVKLGATYGYDFNWVQAAKAGGLSGDIGLKIQLGVSMALGFSASGKYAVVLSRDSLEPTGKQLRLRLYKLKSKGWDFALNAVATVTGDTSKFLPGQFDQFIAAVLGLDPAQLMADLQALKKWTDPATPLPDLLAGVGVDGMRDLLGDLTGFDLETQFKKARAQVVGLLNKWNGLDHEVGAKLWSFVGAEGGSSLTRVRALAQQIVGINDDTIRALVAKRLAEVDFPTTPEGQWLETAVGGKLLNVLTVPKELEALQKVAGKTLAILDGSKMQETLTRLHQRIDEKLGIDQIQQAVDEDSFEKLDALLKAKLSRFLGSKVDFAKVQEIRKTIDLLLSKRQQFYDKSIAALNKSYQFKFAATYQRNTARTELLDVVFDFAKGDLTTELRNAVDGRFDSLLVDPVPGVTLNMATLTHEITRQSNVSVDLPFFKKNVTTMNDSLAKFSAVDDDGRILMYDLDAGDTITEAVNAKTNRNSRLAIGGVVSAKAGDVRRFSGDGLTYDYSFSQATENLMTAGLEFMLEPYVSSYFPDHFTPDASFRSWLDNIDRTIDEVEHNGTSIFGNTLLSLEVSLPSAVTAAWLKAPASAKDPAYSDMSRNLQAALKRALVYCYFQDVENYKSIKVARTLLAYAAIDPSTWIDLKAGGLVETDRDIYWDWKSKTVRRAMLENNHTSANLGRTLRDIHRRLKSQPGFKPGTVDRYDPDKKINLMGTVEGALSNPAFRSLLVLESAMVQSARQAGLAMAKFAKQMEEKPALAIKALADFGSTVTKTFNSGLHSVYGQGALRPLGSQLYVAAALAFSPSLKKKGAAMAQLTVLKQNEAFPPCGFPDAAPPSPDQIVISQRLVNDQLVIE